MITLILAWGVVLQCEVYVGASREVERDDEDPETTFASLQQEQPHNELEQNCDD